MPRPFTNKQYKQKIENQRYRPLRNNYCRPTGLPWLLCRDIGHGTSWKQWPSQPLLSRWQDFHSHKEEWVPAGCQLSNIRFTRLLLDSRRRFGDRQTRIRVQRYQAFDEYCRAAWSPRSHEEPLCQRPRRQSCGIGQLLLECAMLLSFWTCGPLEDCWRSSRYSWVELVFRLCSPL